MHESMAYYTLFENRDQAGRQLATLLEKYRNTSALVLAIPRGGVPVGYVISRQLELPLDIVLTKKIGHPTNPEFAIGSVSADTIVLDDHPEISGQYIRDETNRIKELLKSRYRRYRRYRDDKTAPDIKGKTVILTDDGIATGNTLLATIRTLRKKEPARVVVAVPVAPLRTCEKISREADEFICPVQPDYFPGVGAFYKDFRQVSDEEVIGLLKNPGTDSL